MIPVSLELWPGHKTQSIVPSIKKNPLSIFYENQSVTFPVMLLMDIQMADMLLPCHFVDVSCVVTRKPCDAPNDSLIVINFRYQKAKAVI